MPSTDSKATTRYSNQNNWLSLISREEFAIFKFYPHSSRKDYNILIKARIVPQMPTPDFFIIYH